MAALAAVILLEKLWRKTLAGTSRRARRVLAVHSHRFTTGGCPTCIRPV